MPGRIRSSIPCAGSNQRDGERQRVTGNGRERAADNAYSRWFGRRRLFFWWE